MFVVNKKDPRQKARQDWRTRVVPADCGPRYLAASLHLMFAPPHGSGLGSGAGAWHSTRASGHTGSGACSGWSDRHDMPA